ncbi:uncharacterized protein LOC126576158 isoform X2 [Anopheles aquasalis]|uniref:uncharacterized protein LOC126576158 isoform X2 n=1 Tax=Anopheles aquasalis TaxID=42839 RepID=UPI00215B5940|nr:uncharacterized protein LOC126576158 isoform X2 [Anopheles aquasalis]
MGCASSSPLINGGGPGGVVESAKEAATKTANDVLHAGEAAIHDVGEHVKDAVQNVTHELENVLGGGGGKKDKSDTINEDDQDGGEDGGAPMSDKDYQIIRLKGSKQNSVDSETLENMKNDMMTKAQQSFGEDPERMADDLMRETEELMRDAETGIAHTRQQVLDEMTTRITSTEDEPEIERILADAAGTDGTNGHDRPASPKATLNTLAVPATATVATNGDEGMMPMMANKPDV